MRRHFLPLALALFVAGCRTATPQASSWPLAIEPAPGGTLLLGVQWPYRAVQQIPLSAETIRVRVRKGETILREVQLSRPETGVSRTATASLTLEAATGLVVRAEAFRAGQASTSVPIASAEATGVGLFPNQRTTVALDLVPQSAPSGLTFTPDNGGPGVTVEVRGAFGDRGPYALALGEARSAAVLNGGVLRAPVPAGAMSGPLTVLADGIPGTSAQSFRVLSRLVMPAAAPRSLTVGELLAVSVSGALDTGGQVVSNPTLTRWEVMDPRRLGLPGSVTSGVGRIEGLGAGAVFTAVEPGTAWIVAWSGALCATMSVEVKP
ncbi:hypothetical protein J7643_13925 [bacterium]|nr:hypothetical protein [bacterium]